MRHRQWFIVCAVCVGLALIVVGVTAQGTTPVLVNPGFDGAFTVRDGASEVRIAEGWEYTYISGDDRQCRSPCFRPEFTPEEQIAVNGKSQRWFTTYARQWASVHQVVNVVPGKWYEFSCDAYAISEPDGQQAVFVGANPWSAGPFDRTMIWGQQQPWGSYRTWNRLTVTFQAWSNKARVAVGANNNYATKNNAAYWDNCSIREVSIGTQPTQTPYPTHTPFPTWTPPIVTPCPTCGPGGGDGCDYGRIRSDVATVVAEWDRR